MTDASLPPMPPEGAKKPPGTVTTAFALLVLVLVFSLISLVASLIYGGDYADAIRENLQQQNAPQDQIDQMATSGTDPLSIVLSLAPSLALVILGYFAWKASNGARIATWVVGGITMLCYDVLGFFGALGTTMMGEVEDDLGYSLTDALDAGVEAAPIMGWLPIATMVGSFLALFVAIILLALPASNDYYRKEPPQAVLPPEAGL